MGSVLDTLYNCSHLVGDHVISSMSHCAFVRIICVLHCIHVIGVFALWWYSTDVVRVQIIS